MEEIWKDIKGYEGLYQASNLGRIKSLEHKTFQRNIFWENGMGYADRKTINVSIYDRKGQRSKKLCTLCNNCYVELLDYLGVCDVNWGDE